MIFNDDKPEQAPEEQTGEQRAMPMAMIGRKILDSRKVFLWGQVDDDSAKHVIDRLLYLELNDPGKEITLFINSPGGYVTSGMAIYDVMTGISSPVSTVCMGLAASMGSILLSAGAKGRRFIFPHGKVMIHQPSGGARGSSSDIEIQMKEILKTKEIGAKILADNCGQPIERIYKDFERDYWMDCDESVEYGIVDGIMTTITL
ncbi:MAG: ATP-dependent Clp protease proteolytic subunit [Candidatus Kapabacteria bacterium]|nr:ATP-dependent Clp protease proteolytic subunit [Candidatus Kapabacteria bacterium]